MSSEALGWLSTVEAPDPVSRSVLKELCGYADTLGVAWAAVPTLAFDLMKSDRHIQRCLRALEKAGLIKPTGRFHHRNVPYYQLAIDTPGPRAAARAKIIAGIRAEASGRRRKGSSNGDTDVTVESSNGDTGVTPNGDMGVTQHQGNSSSDVSSETSSERGRAGEVDVCEVAFAAYPVEGRKGPSSIRLWRVAWASETANGASGLAMLAAVRAYAVDRKAWGSSGRPKTAHVWLGDGCWEAFAADAPPSGQSGPIGWAGPSEIRATAVAAKGEDFACAYVDPANWNGAAVVARTRFAAAKMREVLVDVEILNPP